MSESESEPPDFENEDFEEDLLTDPEDEGPPDTEGPDALIKSKFHRLAEYPEPILSIQEAKIKILKTFEERKKKYYKLKIFFKNLYGESVQDSIIFIKASRELILEHPGKYRLGHDSNLLLNYIEMI